MKVPKKQYGVGIEAATRCAADGPWTTTPTGS